jgi:nucleoside-diphosphate-sugar epimerase
MNIFIAGASGAIGRRLTPLLTAAGYTLHGITRDPGKVAALEAAGVHASVVDVYDAAALREAVGAIAPEYVIHQLTDLPQSNAGGLTTEMMERNTRVRVEGTKNLIAAALEAGVRYVVAQSLITSYAAGPEPHVEADPLDAQTRGSVIELERSTTQSSPLVGCALRFGLLYGPGTWYAEPFGTSPVHVDAAAYATLLAIEQRAPGIFNIAEELGYASSARARALLGWTPAYRITS